MLSIITIMLSIFNLFFGPKGGNMETYQNNKAMNTGKTIYDFTMKDIDGKPVSLKQYEGKVVLIVNVASECGLTPQYKEIQALYDQYKAARAGSIRFSCKQFYGTRARH
jgi:peroxiredoxin